MNKSPGCSQTCHNMPTITCLPVWTIAIAAAVWAFGAGGAHAEASKHGTYVGTIEVTGTELSPKGQLSREREGESAGFVTQS